MYFRLLLAAATAVAAAPRNNIPTILEHRLEWATANMREVLLGPSLKVKRFRSPLLF